MRILQVVVPSSGGVDVHVRALTGQLEERGHLVHRLELSNSAERPRGKDAPGLSMTYGVIDGLRTGPRLGSLLGLVRPEVIHLHSPNQVLSPNLIRRLRRFGPTTVTWHDVRPFCYLGTRRFAPSGELCSRVRGLGCVTARCYRPGVVSDLARMPRRMLLDAVCMREFRSLSRIITVSEYLKGLAIQDGFGIDQVEVIPPFVKLPALSAGTVPGGDATIVFVGRMTREKGVFVLLEALHGLRSLPWRAEFIGEGPERGPLEQQARAWSLEARIEFTGHMDAGNRDRRLRGATMLVAPSLIPEGSGIVGLEALSFGVPVVAFGLGGQSDWLTHEETGLVAHACEPIQLEKQIRRLLENPGWAAELGQRGHDLVARSYQADRCVPRIVDIYHRAIEAARAHSHGS